MDLLDCACAGTTAEDSSSPPRYLSSIERSATPNATGAAMGGAVGFDSPYANDLEAGDAGDDGLDEIVEIETEPSTRGRGRGRDRSPKSMDQWLRSMATLVCCGMLMVMSAHRQDALVTTIFSAPREVDARAGAHGSRELRQSSPTKALPVPFGHHSPHAKVVQEVASPAEKKIEVALRGTSTGTVAAETGFLYIAPRFSTLEAAERHAGTRAATAAAASADDGTSSGSSKSNYVQGDFSGKSCVLLVGGFCVWPEIETLGAAVMERANAEEPAALM